ncbi:MAG: DUF4097 domain-containing protein [bacterium]|nr:DUF4097 domain-containing protein [bacterium]
MINKLMPYGILAIVAITAFALSATASEYTETFEFSGKKLQITNLVGQVEVRPSSEDQIRVTVNVRGEDAETGLIEFKNKSGDKNELVIQFPTGENKKYVYPPMGRNSKTTITFGEAEGSSWLKKILGMNNRITVRGKGSGLEVWADVLVEVPRDRILKVKLGVGGIEADGVYGDLVLDTHSGSVVANNIEGDVLADTGSGKVSISYVNGEINADTGSGSVTVAHCQSREILVDTGSGRVTGEYLVCNNLDVDTGSGGVKLTNVETDNAKVDTGSGSVKLQLDRMGNGKYIIDTGSGSIELDVPENASAIIAADTGSGSMNNELAGAVVKHKERREMTLLIGDAEARVSLDAGSGSITVK